MAEYYVYNLKLPLWCKDYLAEVAWMKRMSIRDYLEHLVVEDAKKNPGIMQTIKDRNNG